MVYDKAQQAIQKIDEALAILTALLSQLTEGILDTDAGSWGDHIIPELEKLQTELNNAKNDISTQVKNMHDIENEVKSGG